MTEVLRVNTRYLVEVVEALDICPFAAGARQTGALERRVVLGDDPLGESLRAIDEIEPNERVVVAILIYPEHEAGWDAFDSFTAALRDADGARRGESRSPFAMAPFHPEAPFGDGTPAQLVLFFRRAPDPCIQLVRFAALDAVRSPAPSGKFLFDGSAAAFAEIERRAQTTPVSERIARDNFSTVERVGRTRFETLFADIQADRARAYARFKK